MSYPRTSLSSVANDIARLHQTLPAASRISTRIEVSGGRTEIVLHLVHHRDRSEANAVFAPLILEASRVEAAIVPYAEAGSQFANAKDHEAGHRWASTGIHLAGPWINSDGLVAMSNNFIKDAGESTRAGLAYAVLGLDVENTDQIKSIDDAHFEAIYDQYAREFGQKWSAVTGPNDGMPVAYPAFCAADQIPAEEA